MRSLLPTLVFIASASGIYVSAGCRSPEHRAANVATASNTTVGCEQTLENGITRELITGKDGGTYDLDRCDASPSLRVNVVAAHYCRPVDDDAIELCGQYLAEPHEVRACVYLCERYRVDRRSRDARQARALAREAGAVLPPPPKTDWHSSNVVPLDVEENTEFLQCIFSSLDRGKVVGCGGGRDAYGRKNSRESRATAEECTDSCRLILLGPRDAGHD
jgi:hypothetical protein